MSSFSKIYTLSNYFIICDYTPIIYYLQWIIFVSCNRNTKQPTILIVLLYSSFSLIKYKINFGA